jgi:hypothetical protein
VIEGVSQVIVEVEDEDQVLKFWTETMSSSRTRLRRRDAGSRCGRETEPPSSYSDLRMTTVLPRREPRNPGSFSLQLQDDPRRTKGER